MVDVWKMKNGLKADGGPRLAKDLVWLGDNFGLDLDVGSRKGEKWMYSGKIGVHWNLKKFICAGGAGEFLT